MNAPFRERHGATQSASLQLFALFHLNLAFSSIEDEQRSEVIARCYWPLLDLAQAHGPIGIELTGFTLEEITRRDPEWIGRFRALIACGKAELIGSGYAQIIGPLVPAAVTEANLRLGNELYERHLECAPRLALVNEQAYSAGLVGLYRDAGYDAILMDWDNPGAQHPDWPAETRYRPQRARGADGRSIGLLWTNTVAFQKLQRFAHGDVARDDYVGYVRSQRGVGRALCVYASDAEIFDFRPGRYKTEEANSGSEWQRLRQAFAALAAERDMVLCAPSAILETADPLAEPLRLETAAVPVPVKKQRKYNLSRWAVTGRDDLGINAACERLYRAMTASATPDWKELCTLWASDFRTHITDRRWQAYCERLRAAESRYATRAEPVQVSHPAAGTLATGRYIAVATPALTARLDRRRGLAIESLHFIGQALPALGGLPHGHFDDIALQADWYTGDCVFEAPGEHKITDLEWCEARVLREADGSIAVRAGIATPKGPIHKTLRFHAAKPQVDFDLVFDWSDWGRGRLRLGHFTLLPDSFDWSALSLTTHNGGKASETFPLGGQTVDHGAPVSFLVSASHGIGMTEGWAEVGDGRTRLRITVDRGKAPLLGLLAHRRSGGSLFCQLMLSALELDETRKPDAYVPGPRQFRFSVNGILPVGGC